MNFFAQRGTSFFPRRVRVFFRCLPILLVAVFAAQRPAAAENHDFRLTGWATAEQGTTGGTGGEAVTVSTPEELVYFIGQPEPLTIQVQGWIDLGQNFAGSTSSGRYYVQSNKTIVGLNGDAGIYRGGLVLANVSNVVIRNLTFREAPDDAIAITHGATFVWIDHNDFGNAADGLLDITRAADFITVSWNRFANHDKVSLVGAHDGSSGDRDRLRVTYHHNWFFETNQRHPRVRYGKVHLYNNLYSNVNVGVGIGVEAQIVSENNYFDNAARPCYFFDTSNQRGYASSNGDTILGGNMVPLDMSGIHWSPRDQYSYALNATDTVPELVMSGAGVGVIDPHAPWSTDG